MNRYAMLRDFEKAVSRYEPITWSLPQPTSDDSFAMLEKKERAAFALKNIMDCHNNSEEGKRFKHEETLYDRNRFDRILLKTALENHTDRLWNIGIAVALALKDKPEHNKNGKEYDYQIELTKTLLFLTENDNSCIEITMSEPRGENNKITNKNTIDLIKNSLLQKFKDLGLNERPMTEDEAWDLLTSGEENWWIERYLHEEAYEANVNEDGNLYDVHELVDDAMIEYYCCENTQQVDDIDIFFLKSKLEELRSYKEATNTKRGRPQKNYHIAYILKELLPLLNNQATNDNFRLIFEYCRFFNLIEDKIISDGYQYIKSVYSSYQKYITEPKGLSWYNQ